MPVGITEKEIETFLVFPNPVKDNLTIQYGSDFKKEWFYEIHDLTGRIILTGKKNHGNVVAEIDVSELKSGLYFIKVFFGKSNLTRKFIVNK